MNGPPQARGGWGLAESAEHASHPIHTGQSSISLNLVTEVTLKCEVLSTSLHRHHTGCPVLWFSVWRSAERDSAAREGHVQHIRVLKGPGRGDLRLRADAFCTWSARARPVIKSGSGSPGGRCRSVRSDRARICVDHAAEGRLYQRSYRAINMSLFHHMAEQGKSSFPDRESVSFDCQVLATGQPVLQIL